MNKILFWESVLLFSLALSCGKSSGEARQELLKLNVEYSVDSFLDRIIQGDAVVVDLFLRSGMNPNVAKKDRETALWLAVDGGHELIVERLVKVGADVNRKNPSGYGTPLTAAAKKNEVAIGRLLVAAGAQVNKPEDALSYAVTFSSADMVRFLLPLTTFEDKSEKFQTALRILTEFSKEKDREAVINAFLEDKDSMRLVTGNVGSEALIEAASEGHLHTVELLVDKGANDLEASKPALIAATKGGNLSIVNLLLDHGADPDWHLSVPCGQPPPPPPKGFSKILSEEDSDYTPLMIAAFHGWTDIVRTLLQHRANPDITDCHGHTALSLAKDTALSLANEDTIKLLKGSKS